jgi:hypothetical protein
MEKISPALHKVLQRRGREKLKKPDSFKSQVVIVSGSVNPHVQTTQEAKRLQEEDKNDKNVSRKTSTTAISSSCNAWSNRVEAIRVLHFSLAGDVVDIEQEEPVYGMPYSSFVRCFFFLSSF